MTTGYTKKLIYPKYAEPGKWLRKFILFLHILLHYISGLWKFWPDHFICNQRKPGYILFLRNTIDFLFFTPYAITYKILHLLYCILLRINSKRDSEHFVLFE